MKRILGRELLDEMPPSDPEAVRSRRDLARLNSLMGNVGAIVRALESILDPTRPVTLADIGAGDGSLMLKVAHSLNRKGFKSGKLLLVDRQQGAVADLHEDFEAMGWRMDFLHLDVFAWAANISTPCDAVIANLFLHHFGDERLKDLFSKLATNTRAMVSVEPRRSLCALTLTHLLRLIGCNRITRHDAYLSVKAGFTRRELSGLWGDALNDAAVPGSGSWDLTEQASGIAGHLFIARPRTP